MEFGVSTNFYNEMDLDNALEVLSESGWANIEFSAMHMSKITQKDWKMRLERLRQTCESLCVKPWQMHSPGLSTIGANWPLNLFDIADSNPKKRLHDLETAKEWIGYCQILNVPVMVIHPEYFPP